MDLGFAADWEAKFVTGTDKCTGCFGAANNDCRICPFHGKQGNLDTTKYSTIIFLSDSRIKKGVI